MFVSASPLLASAADVNLAWDPVTNPVLAGYRIGYGTVSGQYGTVIDVGNVTAHTISGLSPGTYYFAVKAYGTAGQESSYSNEVTSSVAPPADTQPPEISSVYGSNVTASSATISWNTNENSNSRVEYGTTSAYGNATALDTALVTSHSQTLTGLTAATLYHYRVHSGDASGNLATSVDFTLVTAPPADTAPPVISGVGSSSVKGTSATISWTTNENADSQVEYGTTTAYGQSTTVRTALVTSHSQDLSALASGTTYHYRVKSMDAAGNLGISGDYTFATPSSVDITTGLAAAFAFDEGSGYTSADLSGNGNTASLSYVSWTTGKYGKALSFNGNNSYARAGITGMPAVNQPKTISCWAYLLTKPKSMQSMLALANPDAGAAVHHGLKSSQTGVLAFGDTWMLVTRVPSLKTWHHFGYVFDGKQNRLYIDGNLVGTSTIEPAAGAVTDFEIGRWVGGSEYFKGSIDEVRVYSRALGLDELKAVMNTSIASAPFSEALPAEEENAPVEEPELQPAVNPAADIRMERLSYRPGVTVKVETFRISNPSTESREIEVKTWMALPGMEPIPLDLGTGDMLDLAAEFNQDYGTAPVLTLSRDAPAGTGEVNVRLLDPVTGEVLSEDINSFTIRSRMRSVVASVPQRDIVLQTVEGGSGPQYVISNMGAEPAVVEFKVWLELEDGALMAVLSAGADGSLILPAGSDLSLDPLASVQKPSGSYFIRARLLDAASGEILFEK